MSLSWTAATVNHSVELDRISPTMGLRFSGGAGQPSYIHSIVQTSLVYLVSMADCDFRLQPMLDSEYICYYDDSHDNDFCLT